MTRVDGHSQLDRPSASTGSTAANSKLTPAMVDTLLVSAVRYALGRQSYIVGVTCDMVRAANPNADVRAIIRRDIDNCRDYGMEMDRVEWRALREWLDKPQAAVAVDPQAADTGTLPTREGKPSPPSAPVTALIAKMREGMWLRHRDGCMAGVCIVCGKPWHAPKEWHFGHEFQPVSDCVCELEACLSALTPEGK